MLRRILRNLTNSPVLFLLCCAGSATAAAQPPELRDPGQKTVRMVRAATAPAIDGVLDDPVWETAARIDDLHQVTPQEYAEPSERSEVFLLFDDDALYIAARLYDSEPELITAQNLRQNDNIGDDDRFFVTLDPFNSQRSGYFFGVNANGVRMDGLYQNVSESNRAWDGIFSAAATRFEQGWLAEMRIPFTTISFDETTDAWGINFSRGVARKNESMAWVSRNRAFDPSSSGLATGFTQLDQGLGLELSPSASFVNMRRFGPDSSDHEFEPSLDVAYRVTPSLNASFTINTDFSATEVDDRQVNLTRFGVFFPEKRDFFLREADIFEFGRIGAPVDAVYMFQGGQANQQSGRPFFSRNIGLSSNGQPVDLDYGAKLSGRVGRWELGALSIRQDEFAGNSVGSPPAPAAGADTLSVVRAKLGILTESSVGVIATEGSPRNDTESSLAGVDFLYRNTRLPGGRTLEAEAWVQQSDSDNSVVSATAPVIGSGMARGVGIRLPSTNGVRVGAAFKEFDADFDPALGFINRRGITDSTFDLSFTHRPRTGRVQSLKTSFDAQRFELTDGRLQSRSLNLRPFQITNRSGDSVDFVYRDYREVLYAPFAISARVAPIPAGTYDFHDTGSQLRTGAHRRVAGLIRVVDGTFYNGARTDMVGELTWRPSPKFRSNVSYTINEIELPQGAFETRLVRVGLDYVFSSTMSWVNLIQYDNISETIGINMRWHWIPQAGRELYFVVNQNLADPERDNSFVPATQDATIKFNYTFLL
jgi:hypothetical protein